jgi:hypothetical protein
MKRLSPIPWEPHYVQLHNMQHFLDPLPWQPGHEGVRFLTSAPLQERQEATRKLLHRYNTVFEFPPSSTFGIMTWSTLRQLFNVEQAFHLNLPKRRYTFVITNRGWYFTPTASSYQATQENSAMDQISKHLVLARVANWLFFAGEFYFEVISGALYLVMDNNSGTYFSPPERLEGLYELMKHNFPDIPLIARDFRNPSISFGNPQRDAV